MGNPGLMADDTGHAGIEARARQLESYLASARNAPFIWGSHDCALFAADWVAERMGVDPAADLRGRYDDEAGARELLGDDAAAAIAALAAEAGLEELSPRFARRGDVLLFDQEGWPTLALCIGAEMAVPRLPRGLARFRIGRATRGWRVP